MSSETENAAACVRTSQPGIVASLAIAAAMLLMAAGLRWLAPAYISDELAHRLLGIMLGLFAFYYANAVPKALTPLARLRCDPAKEQALRRFSGWTLAVGSLVYIWAWIALPPGRATVVSIAALATALLVVLLRHLWVMLGQKR